MGKYDIDYDTMTYTTLPPNVFSHAPIDRQGLRRRDVSLLHTLSAEQTRILPVRDGQIAATAPDAAPRLAFANEPGGIAGPLIFLGSAAGHSYFTARTAADDPAFRFEDLRKLAPLLPAEEASLAAYALGLVRWHERNGFCAVCGHATDVTDAGHKRVCPYPACAAEHFPRTDPAIIVLVEHEDSCLLARNARHRAGLYSTLAGFVEPGESLEAAVEREVWEEAQVRLGALRYHSSQPWPFPASLMIGFHARAASRNFKVDGEEIVEAAWFTRAQLAPCVEDGAEDETFALPGKLSISRRLIEEWYHAG